MNLYLFIAKKFACKGRERGRLGRISNVIATISVAISVAVVIVAIAVANGFRYKIRESATGFMGDITLSAPGADITDYLYPVQVPSYIDTLKNLKEVESVSGVAYRSGIIKSGEQIHGALFKGVDSLYNRKFYEEHLVGGQLPDYGADTASNAILLSSSMANLLGYSIGDKLFAYFVGEQVTFRIFTVCGIYNAPLEEMNNKIIVADIDLICSVNGWEENRLSGYEIVLKKRYGSDNAAAAAEIERVIMEQTPSDDSFALLPSTVEERFYILYDWLRLLDINVVILLLLMTAVAGFNMVSGALIMLFERIPQIGLFKALGMRNKNIAKIFLYRSSFILLKGLVAGNLIALLFCYLEWKYRFIPLDAGNYFVNHVPIYIEWRQVIVADIAAFLLIMAILLVPCRIISRISPARTLVVR